MFLMETVVFKPEILIALTYLSIFRKIFSFFELGNVC